MKFLTFNPDLESVSAVPINVDPSELAALAETNPDDMQLESKWKIWEQLETGSSQDYANSMKLAASFSTVHGFWEVWNVLPQPSQLMMDKRMVRKADGRTDQPVDAIMIFRDDVEPMWEDPLNAVGGHYEIRYQQTDRVPDKARVDEHWNNIVLGMIGATLDPEGMITGVRLVDKLHTSGRTAGNIRIEVWFTEKGFPPDAKNILKANLEKFIRTKLDGTKDGSTIHLVFRTHRQKR